MALTNERLGRKHVESMSGRGWRGVLRSGWRRCCCCMLAVEMGEGVAWFLGRFDFEEKTALLCEGEEKVAALDFLFGRNCKEYIERDCCRSYI